MKNKFNIIVAHDSNRGIGINNGLPWKLKGDMEWFKKITSTSYSTPNVVIMGRKTWESIPKQFSPLPKRTNVVISRQENLDLPEGVIHAKSLDEALLVKGEDTFVIGGSQIYSAALKHSNCKGIFVTRIQSNFNCDAHFPEYEDQFERTVVTEQGTENDISYIIEYRKKIDD